MNGTKSREEVWQIQDTRLWAILLCFCHYLQFFHRIYLSIKVYSQGLGDFLDNLLDDNDNGDDIKKKIEKELKDRDKDKDKKQETEKEENFATKDYNFADKGEKERKSFNFAVAGDFGCSKNAKNTVSNMKDKKPELVIPLGDISYDKSANCWLDLISPFNDRLKVTLGYHDVNDGEPKLNQYEETLGLKNHYNSFDYRHVHFVIMSSLSKFDKGSEQYKFISEDLKKASEDKEIDWIIVTSYSPLYTSPSKHTAEKDMRDIYHPLFEQYGVNLCTAGTQSQLSEDVSNII